MKLLMSVIVLALVSLSFVEMLPWETTGIFILCAFTGAYIFHLKVPQDS